MQDGAVPSALGGREQGAHLRNMRQALQLVVLSNVYIWKLWWLALALSGLMFDLEGEWAPGSLSPTDTGTLESAGGQGARTQEPGTARTPRPTRGP